MRKRKKWVKKLAVFLCVAAVGGYALYDYYRSSEKTKEEEKRSHLLSQDIEDVQEIQITTEGKKPVVLTKKKQRWMMKSPVWDFADSAAIASWFNQLKEKKMQNITPKETIQWEEYGLDEKAFQVDLSLKSDEKILFSVSWKPSFDGKYFVRRGNALLMGDNSFKAAINEKDPLSFRSLNALHTSGHPLELTYRGKENFSFTWSDYRWAFKKSAPFPLKATRLSKFWSDLSAFKALEIVGAASESNLKKYGLNKPETTIQLKFRSQNLQLRISAVKDDTVFIHASNRNYILECSKNQAEKLILSEKVLRDHAAPFKYKKADVSLLELKGEKYAYTARKNTKAVWESTETSEAKGKKINSQTIQTILNSLARLKGERYSRAPLWRGAFSVNLKDEKGKSLFSLKAGQPFKDSGKEMFWVKTNLSKDKVAISKASLDKIFEKDPYKTKPVKKKEEKKTDSNPVNEKKPEDEPKDSPPEKGEESKNSIFQYQKKK